jgi:hypothetical protein
VLLLQRIEQLVEIAVHDLVQLVERQIDAVIGHPPLRKVVSADALRSVAAADLQTPRPGLRAALLLLLRGKQPRAEQLHRAGAILVLRALILTLDHDAGRQVGDAHRGVGLVDVLSARARGAISVDAQVCGIDRHFLDLVELRKDRNRARRGMDPPLCLGLRDPLHAVGAGLELQP